MSHSVLVVEDDAETREYVAEALRGADYNVRTAATFQQAEKELGGEALDIMLVDLDLPDGNGLDLIRNARTRDILSLVISVFGEERIVIAAIEAGAQGYLLKSEVPDDLRESVRQVLAGGAPISPGIASHLLRRLQASEVPQERSATALTPRERDILRLMVKGLSHREAGKALGLTRNTVASYVKIIYSKLEVNSRGEAVYEALSSGIVKLDPKL